MNAGVLLETRILTPVTIQYQSLPEYTRAERHEKLEGMPTFFFLSPESSIIVLLHEIHNTPK